MFLSEKLLVDRGINMYIIKYLHHTHFLQEH